MEMSAIQEAIREVFDPVAARLGFVGPEDVSVVSYELNLAYRGQTIGLQLDVTFGPFFIFVLLCRLTPGKDFPVGYDDESGRRQKVHLQHALEELSVDVAKERRELRRLARARDSRNCREMAGILARLLEDNWPRILGDLGVIFP